MTRPSYTLLEHRNGTLYVLINRHGVMSEVERQELGVEIAGSTRRQVLGLTAPIPTQSTPGMAAHYGAMMLGFRTEANIAAMRASLAANGDTSPALQHDSYVVGKFPHLLYTEQVQLLQVQEPRSDAEAKVMEAILRSYKYMPAEVAERLRAFFTAQNIALMATTFGIYAASHFFGIGFMLDVVLAGVAAAALGVAATQALVQLVEFYGIASKATTEAELEEAAKLFADALLTLGVTTVTAVVTRRALSSRDVRDLNQSVMNRTLGSNSGSAVKPNRAIQDMRGRLVGVRGNRTLVGPQATAWGRTVNLAEDAFVVVPDEWDDIFVIAAHAYSREPHFFRSAGRTGPMHPREVAAEMFRAGYGGGDVILFACWSGLNRALVQRLFQELSLLKLKRPVGSIHAPRTVVNGLETYQAHPVRGWAQWETFSFNH